MASSISHCRLIVAEPGYASRQRALRAQRGARARRNLSEPPSRQAPSIANGSTRTTTIAAAWWLAALVGHGGLAYAAWHAPLKANTVRETIHVRVISTPPKLVPIPPVAPAVDTPVEPVIEAKRAVSRKPTPKPPAVIEETTPVSEPIAEVVGLTPDATVSTGPGPAFATGHTLSGVTDAIAKPYVVPAVEQPLSATLPTVRPSRNRLARSQPAVGTHVEPARRLSQLQPEYPELLQNLRIEGDVTVRVTLSAQGAVQHVELLRAASEAAFNDAALVAARRERFVPETRDGRPVSTSLTYTYRFRINP